MTDGSDTAPQVMAMIQYSDEEFLCGIGSTREKAHAAMLEGQDLHESVLRLPVTYLRMTSRSTGWSTDAGENMG